MEARNREASTRGNPAGFEQQTGLHSIEIFASGKSLSAQELFGGSGCYVRRRKVKRWLGPHGPEDFSSALDLDSTDFPVSRRRDGRVRRVRRLALREFPGR